MQCKQKLLKQNLKKMKIRNKVQILFMKNNHVNVKFSFLCVVD